MQGVLRLAWLGHSTVVIDMDGVRILTDPLLRRNAGLLRRRAAGPDPSHWTGSDAVLLSHLHHDHAELASLRMLPETPILTASENADWLRRHGVSAAVALGDGWQGVGAGDVQVHLVPAVHHHRLMPHRPNAAHGHLLRGPTASLWVAGDTSLYDEMSELPALLGRPALDVAVVPIAGWGPRLSEGHMGVDQAAMACARSGARWALPVHWGTLHPPLMTRFGSGWFDRPGDEFEAALQRLAPECRAIRLRPGERATVAVESGDGGQAGPAVT